MYHHPMQGNADPSQNFIRLIPISKPLKSSIEV